MSSSTHNRDTSTSSNTRSKSKSKPKSSNLCVVICDAIDNAHEKRERRAKERTGPRSWFERKFIVGVVLALFGWSSYDFLGVILRKCLLRSNNALVGFAGGIVLTIFYCLFWIMFMITYLKLIFTSPGYARDHLPRSEPPLPSDPPPELNTTRAHNDVTYPPSIRAPTSEYRPSTDGRITHHSASLDDHGEFDTPAIRATRNDDDEGDGSTTVGVPYSSMQARRHKRNDSGSNVAIPPTPRGFDANSSSTASSPVTPNQPKPALLRKNSKPSTPPSLSEPKTSNKLIRASFSSRNTSSPPASPRIPTFSNTRRSESSREGVNKKTQNEMLKPTSGFRFDSTSTMDPSRGHSRTQSASGTVNVPTTLPTPSLSAPQTPSVHPPTPKVVIGPSGGHPTVNLAGRTEPMDDEGTEIHERDLEDGRPIPYLDDLPPVEDKWRRRPSDQPVLDPFYRYCTRDGIIKPMRAHHCRICDTCVLGYDHHCPWVGGCVGARNRKFFVVFLFWSSIYTFYTLALLIATLVKDGHPRPSPNVPSPQPIIDGDSIALVVVTALFAFFSFGMFLTHLHLLLHNASTVEWHGIQSMREQERAVVAQAVPVCGCLGLSGEGEGGLLESGKAQKNPWQEEGLKGYKGRVTLRKRFDEEWGRVGKEGNLWWLGSSRANWEAVMGSNIWIWFLPIGDTSNVGLRYPTNPRFDEHGRWMRRSEWPPELR